jgi:hypothetical protein
MLVIDNRQISFADLIPEELTELDDELSMLDEYLDDVFLKL